MDVLIDVRDLKKEFGSHLAVNDISFRVNRGEVLGFLGPNGAGKSTTMKMIAGYLTPTAGSVSVAGFDIYKRPVDVKKAIGYLPEGAPLYPEMTPASILDFTASVRGLSGKEKVNRIAQVVESVHLESVWHQPLETLSKGFKRRVGLALAILHDPQVLILDEPTDGLDPNQKQEVRKLVKEMAEEKAIIISTHILEEVDALCSRALIIADGSIVADGTPAELKARSDYHQAVTITVIPQKATEMKAQLQQVPGVASVDAITIGEEVQLTAIPKEGELLATRVSRIIAGASDDVTSFSVEQGRLDEVFRNLTRKEVA